MPTQSTTYNTRLTDEALEKRFRDAFRSQGGSELVDDLYASGVIVPIVDFTAAAEGSSLRSDLQSAWDFATDHANVANTTSTLVSTPGFWKIDLNVTMQYDITLRFAVLNITDGLATKEIWRMSGQDAGSTTSHGTQSEEFVVFLRTGDSITAQTNNVYTKMDVVWRQIADVYGNLVNPTGFVSS